MSPSAGRTADAAPGRGPILSRLAWRIFLAIFATLLTVALGAIAITSWYLESQREAARQQIQRAVQSAAVALAEGGREGLAAWAGDRSAARRFLVIDDWGLELLDRPIPPPLRAALIGGRTEPLSGAPDVLILDRRSFPTLTSEDGERFRLLPLPSPPRRVGPLPLPDVRLSLLLMAFGVTVVASLLLARSITRPVRDLERATRALAAGDLDARVPVRTAARRDEIGRLAGSLDAMAVQLGELLRARERLLRDVSHEIRSPLARMRLATGLAAQGADATTQLTRIDTEIGRLDALVSDILDVSRLEAGVLQRERIDLLATLERLAADARFEAESLGRRLDWTAPGTPCWISGDPHWVTAAAENVVRNALRHTPAGTTVSLQLAAADDGYALTVRDAGPGLPTDQLERVFEPFHRVATDRGRDSGGAGLGLAIAARVMRAHGGRIAAQNLHTGVSLADAPPCGLEMRLWWPAADAAGADDAGTLSRS